MPTLTVGSWSRFLPLLKPKMAWRTALGLPLPLRMEASALACRERFLVSATKHSTFSIRQACFAS